MDSDPMDIDPFAHGQHNPLAEEAFEIQRATRKRLFGDMEANSVVSPSPANFGSKGAAMETSAVTSGNRRKFFSNPFGRLFKKANALPHADSGTAATSQVDLLSQLRTQYPTLFHLYCIDQAKLLTRDKLRTVAYQQLKDLGFPSLLSNDATDGPQQFKRAKSQSSGGRSPQQAKPFMFNLKFWVNPQPAGQPNLFLPDRAAGPIELHGRSIRDLFEAGPVVVAQQFPPLFGATIRLPFLINELVSMLLQPRSLHTQGLFRLAGSTDPNSLREWIFSLTTPSFGNDAVGSVNPHDLAVTLKRWFGSAPEDQRLFPPSHSRAIEVIVGEYKKSPGRAEDARSTSLALRAVIQCLDVEHLYVLAALLLVVRSVVNNVGRNLMDAESLAKMFAPNVFVFSAVLQLDSVMWAIQALSFIFSEPNMEFWFTPIDYQPFLVQPYAPSCLS